MSALDPFQRAMLIALAWWLIGLSVDMEPHEKRTPLPPREPFASLRAESTPPPTLPGPNRQ